MPSINLNLDYFDHPKTDRLIHLLGRGSEVLPIRLWVYCGKHFRDTGRLTEISAQEIETAVRWWGKQGQAFDALVKCRFLEIHEDGFQVHDWHIHARHLKAYTIRAKKAAEKRWSSLESGADPPMLQALDKHSSSNHGACVALDGEAEEVSLENAKRFIPKDVAPAPAVVSVGTQDNSPGWLARMWWERKAGHKGTNEIHAARTTFEDMIGRKCPAGEIAKEINASRTLTEPIWDFESRVMARLGLVVKEGKHGQPSKRGRSLAP